MSHVDPITGGARAPDAGDTYRPGRKNKRRQAALIEAKRRIEQSRQRSPRAYVRGRRS